MNKTAKYLIIAVVLIAVVAAGYLLPVKQWITELVDLVRHAGALGVALFIAAYVLATVLFLPGFLFTAAAGLLFGLFWGTAVALFSATIGATAAFLISRYLMRDQVRAYAKKNRRFAAIDHAIGANGWKIVGLLRLSPVLPFNVSNYFYGITAIRLWPYIAASAIGMLPGTLLYAYLGAIGKATLDGKRAAGGKEQYIVIGIGLVATAIGAVFIGRIAQKALGKTAGVQSASATSGVRSKT